MECVTKRLQQVFLLTVLHCSTASIAGRNTIIKVKDKFHLSLMIELTCEKLAMITVKGILRADTVFGILCSPIGV